MTGLMILSNIREETVFFFLAYTDALMLDVCNSELEVEVYYWKTLRGLIGCVLEYASKESGGDDAEASQRRQQRHRPIIVKFNSCRKRQAVFAAKKKLKGNQKAILENLIKERLRIFNIAKVAVEHRNIWTADGKIFAKCIEIGQSKH